MYTVLSEATQVDVASLAPLISSVVNMGGTLWGFYYIMTVAMPSMQKQHQEERGQIRQELLQMMERQSTTMERVLIEMKESREMYDRWKTKWLSENGFAAGHDQGKG